MTYRIATCVLALLVAIVAAGTAAADGLTFDLSLPAVPTGTSAGKMVPRYKVVPLQGLATADAINQATAGATVPMWTAAIQDGTSHFHFSMIGRNPEVVQSRPTTTVKTFVIPVAVNFKASGVVFDPTLADPVCANSKVPLTLTAQSPLFKTVGITVGGTDLGTSQYVDLFQRANFQTFTEAGGINPGYHVTLAEASLPASRVTFNVSGGTAPVAVTCGKLGKIDFNAFDAFLQTKVFPNLPSEVATNTFPIFLLYGVVLTDSGGCCIIGYHTAFGRNGVTQTYAVADYDTSKAFTALSDVSGMSHEIAEWMDDPLGANPTKPWGNIGQVTGCQSNLEVGDPLSGQSLASFTMANKVTYHVQDLAFLSWFYHQSPSIGVNGWYSLFGHFRTPAAACH